MSRPPVSLQAAQTECGLCCACSVLGAHGQHVTTTELRSVFEPGRDGLSLLQVGELLRRRGMRTAVYRVKDPAGTARLPTPFVAHWEGRHFVVVERVSARSVVVMDPMTGRTRMPRPEFDKSFSSMALTAEPGADFCRRRRPPFASWRNKPLLPAGAGLTYAATAGLSLLVFGLTLVLPWLTERLVDRIAEPGFSLGQSLVAVLGVAVTFVVVHLARSYVTTDLVRRVSWQLLTSAFGHLVRLPLTFFVSRAPGELMYRLNSMNQVRDIIATQLVQGVLDALTAVVLIGYVFTVSATLGLAVSAIFLGGVVLLLVGGRLVKSATDTEVHHTGRTQSIQLDAVVSIIQLRVGGYAERYLDEWRDSYRSALTAMTRRIRVQQGWIGSLVAGVQSFAPLAILLTSLAWARSGTVTLGQAVAVQGVSALLFGLSGSISQTWTQAVVASRYLERVDDIYAYPAERSGGRLTEVRHSGIRLQDVGFRYPGAAVDVLVGIDVEIPDGAVVALVGESGSGKTTLGKLLCSLHEPTSGTILIGGEPLQDYDLDALRSRIGYIPQEGYLHNRTLAANLALGTDLDEDDAVSRCREMAFLDFVDDLPMRYETVVSEMGANFSGGQRQRVAVAKAILRSPRLLVMDEATSALDNVNQRLVHDHVALLRCTRVVIAHRLSTVVDADLILVLHRGRLVDSGTHHELTARGGDYARLYGSDGALVHG